ncbi:MAG: fumarylacetoacetate hydrolase family protein [Bacteroidota bacterium]
MRVAQFTQSTGECIGVDMENAWVDFTKALALYALVKYGSAGEMRRNLGEWLRQGTFDIDLATSVVTFVRERQLENMLSLGKKAVMKAPISRPPKIVALGLNYALHAAEGEFKVPEEPITFLKAGSSVIGPGEPIRLPRKLGRMDHEVELAVVIGKRASEVKKKDAFRYIAGYTILNDVSARELQTKDLEKRHPWFRSKSFDTFTPLGPWMVTANEFPPPIHLDLQCTVNGLIRQQANTRDMVFDIPTQIEFITKYIALDPGDIISTGTPEGIGPIKHGDMVVCHIEKIGELKNPVRHR